jgi:hypothetical protein
MSLEHLKVVGNTLPEFICSLNIVLSELSEREEMELRGIMRHYAVNSGPHGLFMALNNRSVAQIFNEFSERTTSSTHPHASGSIDGVGYTLFPPNEST